MELDFLSKEWSQETIHAMESSDGKDFKRFYSTIKKSARANAKEESCLWCGKKCSGFCNSHTVPQFVLKNIANNGKLFLFNAFLENAFMDYDSGVKNAGNFFMICNKCDSEIFQDYENDTVLHNLQKTDTKAYCEIAIKNLFKHLYKRRIEVETFKLMINICDEKLKSAPETAIMCAPIQSFLRKKIEISELDIKEYCSELNQFRNTIKKCNQNKTMPTAPFNIIDSIILPYTVPIAYQGVITLAVDLEDNIINNLYCDDPKYKEESLHLCILPLNHASLITAFTHKSNTRYRKFKTQFKNLHLPDKLSLLNYMLFLCSEDMFLSGYLDIQSINTEEFQKVVRTNPTDNFNPFERIQNKIIMDDMKKKFSLSNHKSISNLLDADFSMERILSSPTNDDASD